MQLTIHIEASGRVGTLNTNVGTLTLLHIVIECVEIAVAHECHTAINGAAEIELRNLIREEQCTSVLLCTIDMEIDCMVETSLCVRIALARLHRWNSIDHAIRLAIESTQLVYARSLREQLILAYELLHRQGLVGRTPSNR